MFALKFATLVWIDRVGGMCLIDNAIFQWRTDDNHGRNVDELFHTSARCRMHDIGRALDIRSLELLVLSPKAEPPGCVDNVAATLYCTGNSVFVFDIARDDVD